MNFVKNHGPFDSATEAMGQCDECDAVFMEPGDTFEDNKYWLGEFESDE